MRACWMMGVLLAVGYVHTGKIGVVAPTPEEGLVLAAAAEAALGAAAARELARRDELARRGDPRRGDLAPWNVTLAPVEPEEPISMPDQVCAQVAAGVSAIVAYGTPQELELTAAAAARAGVPLLVVAPPALSTPPDQLERWEAVLMYPQTEIFIEVCAALCKEKGWRDAVLLHETAAGPALVQGLAAAGAGTAVLARRLPLHDDPEGEALRNLLLILKKADHNRFIVWCDEQCCDRVLAAAQRVGLLAERHAYILLALDLHTMDLEPYSHGGANITGLQLFDPSGQEEILAEWRNKYLARVSAEENAELIMNGPPTRLILTHDVVLHAARLLFWMDAGAEDAAERCEPYRYLPHAGTLVNYLRSEEWSGAAGERRAGWLRVTELVRGGRAEPVAQWGRGAGAVLWARAPRPAAPPAPGEMTNRTFKVLISLNKPYVMMKGSSERLTGNDRYEGFCIELIARLSELLQFNYTLVEHVGGDYDKMLARLNDNSTDDGDFAITDLTITAKRESVVDFTTPFMNLGISILYKKATAPEPKLFAFMLPFSTGVWFCLGLAYVGTSLVLYVVGRLCPEEWQNPYPCIEEPEALENQFTLANALWFNLGAVLLQGSEIAPVAYGSRAAASAWWLFALVITSSYTANLATLLAKKSNNEDFHNVQELADNQQGITYGAKLPGATYQFFNNSQDELYQNMFVKMQEWDMPKSNDIGIERVKKEGESFAFFMESTSIEYSIERDCNLTQVGGLLDSKGYGIAMAKDSQYRQALNLALLKLQEAGELRAMKTRWWNEMHGGGACKEVEEHENEKLTMKNFVGLFLVLGVGCVLGMLISLVDLMLAARRAHRAPAASYWRRLLDELRFVFHFQQCDKPVHGPLLPPPPPASERVASEQLEEQEGSEEHSPSPPSPRLRSASFQSSAPRSRRRSSLHTASVRLARHTGGAQPQRRDSARHTGAAQQRRDSARERKRSNAIADDV